MTKRKPAPRISPATEAKARAWEIAAETLYGQHCWLSGDADDAHIMQVIIPSLRRRADIIRNGRRK